jgi:preprotein translocase subunit YajC
MPSDLAGLLPLLLILVVFYLLILRPARNRQREALRLQRSLAVGQQVMTTAGLYATVTGLDDDAVILETSPGVTSRWSRAAVARVLPVAGEPSAGGPGVMGTAPDGPPASGDSSRPA